MLVRIANGEYLDRTAYSEHYKKQSDSGLHCFSMPFYVRIQIICQRGSNFETFFLLFLVDERTIIGNLNWRFAAGR